MPIVRTIVAAVLLAVASSAAAQVDESQTGGWYMYFWNVNPEGSQFSFQGDVQHRNWDTGGDLDHIIVRGGVTWSPDDSPVQLTMGYAHFTFGDFGPSDNKVREDRLYQDITIPRVFGRKVFFTHRVRFEERSIDGQDWRTRVRYMAAINYPFNQDTLGKGAIYLSASNEVFANLDRDFGTGQRVDRFDRNWLYLGVGYSLRDDMRLQFGYMHHQTATWGKGQIQLGLFHSY